MNIYLLKIFTPKFSDDAFLYISHMPRQLSLYHSLYHALTILTIFSYSCFHQIKAANSNKGPYDFDQLRLAQDLGREHAGAVWTMKFSPCGRLLVRLEIQNCILSQAWQFLFEGGKTVFSC